MSKDKLIPAIRFPEFSENWEINLLSDMCDVYRGGTFSKAEMDENGSHPCIHYGELFTKYNEVITNIHSKTNKSEGFKSEVGDVLMPSSDVTPDGLAKASAIMLDNVVLGGDMNILRPKKSFNSIFISYLLNHSKKEIIKLVSGTTVKHIYPSQIITCQLPIVNNKPEQQKIAICLSSLDEVIAANSQKLDLLKDHKKGLMQNLFPQEGEKIPKYRFKEFEKDGEWKENILFNLALDGFSNGVFNDPKKVGSGYKLINVINMYSESPISENNLTLLELNDSEFEKNKVKYGDIFFTRSSLVPEGIAKSNIYLGSSDDITYDGHLIRMRPNKELIYPVYLHYLLKTENVRSQMIAKGKTATMTTIGQSDVASVKTSYSKNPKEQQKIASCLSSLDALITAQAEKIEQLKLHKKGLMQGLFPKIND